MSFQNDISELERARNQITKSNRLLDLLVSFFRVRADAEYNSFKKISNVSCDSKCNALLNPECAISSSISAFQVALVKRSEQSRVFSEDVAGGVIDPLLEIFKRHSSLLDSAEKEALTLSKQLETVYAAHNQALQRYELLSHQLDTFVGNPDIHSLDFKVKAGQVACELSQAEKEYHSVVVQLNESRSVFHNHVSDPLHQLLDIFRERSEALQESMEKFFIFELALNRNNQYDNEKSFIEIQQIAQQPAPVFAKAKQLDEIVALSFNSNQTNSKKCVQSVERKIFDAIWQTENSESFSDLLEAMRDLFSTPLGRVSFCVSLSTEANEIPTESGLKKLGRILCLLLDLGDFDSARRVGAFAQKFFVLKDEKKQYIQAEIYHHAIWNRVVFWERALLMSVMDEQIASCRCTFPTSGITLDNFGSVILIFGINPNSARDIVRRVATEHGIVQVNRLLASIDVAQERQTRHQNSISQV